MTDLEAFLVVARAREAGVFSALKEVWGVTDPHSEAEVAALGRVADAVEEFLGRRFEAKTLAALCSAALYPVEEDPRRFLASPISRYVDQLRGRS